MTTYTENIELLIKIMREKSYWNRSQLSMRCLINYQTALKYLQLLESLEVVGYKEKEKLWYLKNECPKIQ